MKTRWRSVALAFACGACHRDAPAPAAAPDLDVAAVTAKSHAFCDAIDRADVKAVEPLLAPSFTRFEQGRFRDRTLVLEELRAQAQLHSPNEKRTWREEHVSVGPSSATFVGEAIEEFAAHDGQPAVTFDGWNTVTWAREGATWNVVHFAIERVPSAREEWNETYRQSFGFKHEPNQLLVDAVKGHRPGDALDLAMGQGRNALYLASLGWHVTGIDISDEGLRIAKREADAKKLPLETIEADLDAWDYGKERWDLVTMIYAGADPAAVEKAKASLRHGGLFVVEVFHTSGTGGTRSSGFATGQLAAAFKSGFTVLRDEVVDDLADWGGPNKVKLVRFVAQKN